MFMRLHLLCLVIMDKLLKLSLNNEKHDSHDCVTS